MGYILDAPLYDTPEEAEQHRQNPSDRVIAIGDKFAILSLSEYLLYTHHC